MLRFTFYYFWFIFCSADLLAASLWHCLSQILLKAASTDYPLQLSSWICLKELPLIKPVFPSRERCLTFFLLSRIRKYQQLLMTIRRKLEIRDRSCQTPLLCFFCMCFVAASFCYNTRHRARAMVWRRLCVLSPSQSMAGVSELQQHDLADWSWGQFWGVCA